jgi:hypothetical protein
MTDRSDHSPDSQWIQSGRGIGPSVKWTFGTEGPLTDLQLSRESGEVLASDATGGLYRLDRKGQFAAVTRAREPIRAVAVSDDGQCCAALVGPACVTRYDRNLKTQWQLDLPSECLALAVDPYGQYIAVSLAEAGLVVYDAGKRRVSRFEPIRPLSFIRFVVTEPLLIAAADHGLLCCISLDGEKLWEEKIWSNVGSLAASGDGESIYLATYSHGVQVFDGDGESVGSYVVEGTVKHVASSYEPHRLAAATIERHLYLLDPDGERLWATRTPQDVVQIASDPFGETIVCGFADGHVVGLDWSRS